MKKTLHIIAPYPKGEAPSQRFRYEQYLSAFEEQNWEIKYHAFHSRASWERLYHPGKFPLKAFDVLINFLRRWFLLFRLIGAKHIFMHREMAHMGPPVFEWILVKVFRRKYHYDFDDAIWIPNYSTANAKFQKLKCYWKVPKLIKWASSVSAGNDYLVNYALQYNENVTRIPTTIDTKNQHNVSVDHHFEKVIIGWTGTHSTMHYLDRLIPILRKLEVDFEFEFLVISNKKPNYQLKSLRYLDWKLESEIADLGQIQVGLMPLDHDMWAEGKCGFKALQYMALGMACVVSPVGVNTAIVKHGVNGMIADTDEEWEMVLRDLLTGPERRKPLGENAKKTIEEHWSVEAWKQEYLRLIEKSKV